MAKRKHDKANLVNLARFLEEWGVSTYALVVHDDDGFRSIAGSRNPAEAAALYQVADNEWDAVKKRRKHA